MGHHYTWDKLAKNAYRLNTKSRGPNYPGVPRWEISKFTSGVNKDSNVIVPYKGTSTLLISLRAWGVTQSSMHSVTLMFHEVEILTENPMNPNYFQIQYKGQMYWIKKLDKYRNPLTHRCTCKDSFFTWAWYLHRAGCLYGPAPRPYIRKTTWAKPRNPQGVIGCCKHVYHAWKLLHDSGLTIN